jgi:hypothetical protein
MKKRIIVGILVGMMEVHGVIHLMVGGIGVTYQYVKVSNCFSRSTYIEVVCIRCDSSNIWRYIGTSNI